MSELSSDAKALIERTRLDDAPRAEDKDRIRERLAAQLGVSAFAGAALIAGSAVEATQVSQSGMFLKSTLLRWIGGAVAATGVVAGALLVSTSKEEPKRVVVSAPVVEAPVVVAPVEAAPAEPPPVEAAPVEATPVEAAPTVAKRQPRKRAVAPAFAPVGNSGSMNAEIALLAQAQKALRARDGKEALRLARQHAENFPSGALYEERVGIEAIAHCVLGEREHPAVRAFLARSPRSPLSARVRKECGVP